MQLNALYPPLSTSLLIVPGVIGVVTFFDGVTLRDVIRMRYTVTYNVTEVDENFENVVSETISALHCDELLMIQNTIIAPYGSAGDTFAFQRSG